MNDQIKAFLQKEKFDFYALVELVEILRSPDGCPWDREQDHKSIRNDIIEETYEVIEAIDTDNRDLLREELGDVMLQTVFHARIEEEVGGFTVDDVTDELCRKLIHRHPHVFGDVEADTSEQVLKNWDAIKSDEKKRETLASKLNSVPPSLPSLMKAQKIASKAAKYNFDFACAEDAFAKVYEEADEVKEALAAKNEVQLADEIGDLLFAVTNTARLAGIDSERALSLACEKFTARVSEVERLAMDAGKDMKEMSAAELDALWNQVKAQKSGSF